MILQIYPLDHGRSQDFFRGGGGTLIQKNFQKILKKYSKNFQKIFPKNSKNIQKISKNIQNYSKKFKFQKKF